MPVGFMRSVNAAWCDMNKNVVFGMLEIVCAIKSWVSPSAPESGSSRIAAYDAGLDFVGLEIDKEYFDKQEERFAAHTAQMSLFV